MQGRVLKLGADRHMSSPACVLEPTAPVPVDPYLFGLNTLSDAAAASFGQHKGELWLTNRIKIKVEAYRHS